MVNVSFQNHQLEGIKHQINRSDEDLIDGALEVMVDEIFESYADSNKDDGLNFHEWCNWFCSLDGINEMLMSNS